MPLYGHAASGAERHGGLQLTVPKASGLTEARPCGNPNILPHTNTGTGAGVQVPHTATQQRTLLEDSTMGRVRQYSASRQLLQSRVLFAKWP